MAKLESVSWSAAFTTNRGFRVQFNSWSIPTDIRQELEIEDGAELYIRGSIKGNLVVEAVFRITSGGEFRVSAHDAREISRLAANIPLGSIHFQVADADLVHVRSALNGSIDRSLRDDPGKRRQRLENAPKLPRQVTVSVSIFMRNPDVVAEVLTRAEGRCEACHSQAPFIRKSDSTPYLEVHHKVTLADGGEDTVENAIALCPNCHRRKHLG